MGLAASLGLISCGLWIIFLDKQQLFIYTAWFSMAGALLAFLIYNFPPTRIFMGDSAQ